MLNTLFIYVYPALPNVSDIKCPIKLYPLDLTMRISPSSKERVRLRSLYRLPPNSDDNPPRLLNFAYRVRNYGNEND